MKSSEAAFCLARVTSVSIVLTLPFSSRFEPACEKVFAFEPTALVVDRGLKTPSFLLEVKALSALHCGDWRQYPQKNCLTPRLRENRLKIRLLATCGVDPVLFGEDYHL